MSKAKDRKPPAPKPRMCPYSSGTSPMHHFCGKAKDKTFNRKIDRTLFKCPECGRRIRCKIILDQDETCILVYFPKHKRKGWWKHHSRR